MYTVRTLGLTSGYVFDYNRRRSGLVNGEFMKSHLMLKISCEYNNFLNNLLYTCNSDSAILLMLGG